MIYSHSHADHFGGVRGVVDEADVQAGRVQVIAPLGFMEDAISENVTAGNAMARRNRLPVWPAAAQRHTRPGGRRPGQNHLQRQRDADSAHGGHFERGRNPLH